MHLQQRTAQLSLSLTRLHSTDVVPCARVQEIKRQCDSVSQALPGLDLHHVLGWLSVGGQFPWGPYGQSSCTDTWPKIQQQQQQQQQPGHHKCQVSTALLASPFSTVTRKNLDIESWSQQPHQIPA